MFNEEVHILSVILNLPPCPDQMDSRHLLVQFLPGFFSWRNGPKGNSHLQLVPILIMSGSVPPLFMRRHDSFLNTNENTGKRKFEVTSNALRSSVCLLVYQLDREFRE